MAYFLRKVAIIGFIACNSPLMTEKSDEAAVTAVVEKAVGLVQAKTHPGQGGTSAARETAQFLAGMDPQLRERLLSAAATTAAVTSRPPHR